MPTANTELTEIECDELLDSELTSVSGGLFMTESEGGGVGTVNALQNTSRPTP